MGDRVRWKEVCEAGLGNLLQSIDQAAADRRDRRHQSQPFPSAKYVAVSANQTLDFEAICVLTTDLPDSTVHRRRRYRRTTTSKQASKNLHTPYFRKKTVLNPLLFHRIFALTATNCMKISRSA